MQPVVGRSLGMVLSCGVIRSPFRLTRSESAASGLPPTAELIVSGIGTDQIGCRGFKGPVPPPL